MTREYKRQVLLMEQWGRGILPQLNLTLSNSLLKPKWQAVYWRPSIFLSPILTRGPWGPRKWFWSKYASFCSCYKTEGPPLCLARLCWKCFKLLILSVCSTVGNLNGNFRTGTNRGRLGEGQSLSGLLKASLLRLLEMDSEFCKTNISGLSLSWVSSSRL